MLLPTILNKSKNHFSFLIPKIQVTYLVNDISAGNHFKLWIQQNPDKTGCNVNNVNNVKNVNNVNNVNNVGNVNKLNNPLLPIQGESLAKKVF